MFSVNKVSLKLAQLVCKNFELGSLYKTSLKKSIYKKKHVVPLQMVERSWVTFIMRYLTHHHPHNQSICTTQCRALVSLSAGTNTRGQDSYFGGL